MSTMNIDTKLVELQKHLQASVELAKDAPGFHQMRRGLPRPLSQSRVRRITETAFLDVFLAWEDFIESTFLRYMCGSTTKSGYKPKRYVSPQNLDHALSFFLQTSRSYVDWTSGKDVIDRAEKVFHGGEPYASAIRPSLADLEDMRKTRNAIAHRSEKAWMQFENDVVRRILGYRPRGLVVGLFLALPHAGGVQTQLEYYCDVLVTAAQRIVK